LDKHKEIIQTNKIKEQERDGWRRKGTAKIRE
jgi:hypothetical protein